MGDLVSYQVLKLCKDFERVAHQELLNDLPPIKGLRDLQLLLYLTFRVRLVLLELVSE